MYRITYYLPQSERKWLEGEIIRLANKGVKSEIREDKRGKLSLWREGKDVYCNKRYESKDHGLYLRRHGTILSS